MKYTLLKTDGTKEVLTPVKKDLSKYQKEEPGSLSLEYMYEKIGCDTVERVQLPNGEIWCDEEGLLKSGWRINHEASRLYRLAYPHVNPEELGIAGNAILIEN